MEQVLPKSEPLNITAIMRSNIDKHYKTLKAEVFQYFIHNGLQVPESVKRSFTSYELSQEGVIKNELATLKEMKDFSKRRFQRIKEFFAFVFDLSSLALEENTENCLKDSLNQSKQILESSVNSDSNVANVSFSNDHSPNSKFTNNSGCYKNESNSSKHIKTKSSDSGYSSDFSNHSKKKYKSSSSSYNNKPKSNNVAITKNRDPSSSSYSKSKQKHTDNSSSRNKESQSEQNFVRTSEIEATTSSISECKNFTPYQQKIVESFVNKGFSRNMARNLVQSIGENRRCLIHYKTHWDRWYSWCQKNSVHHFMFSSQQLLNFLKQMKDSGRSSVTVRGKLSSLTFVFKRTIGQQAKLRDPIIKSYLSSIK